MAFDLSAAAKILKVRYLPPIREQLNNATVLMSRIMKDSSTQSVSGKSFTVPLHTNRNKTAGSGRLDGGTLPTAGQQAYEEAIVPNAYIYARIEVTGPTIAATRDNVGAFVQALNAEIEGAVRDMKRSVNRQLHSDGVDALAYWTTADDSSGTNVDDNRGNGFTHLPAGTLTCDLLDASNSYAVIGDDIVVTRGAISSTVTAITWSGSVSGSADGDALVLSDTKGAQMMGIAGGIDDGNPPLLSSGLHGIDATTAGNEYWRAQVVEGDTAGTNQDLTQPRMQKPLDLISTSSDFTEQDVEFMLCSYGVRAKYAELCIQNKYQVNTLELDGGFKGLDYNGIPLVPDPQCRKNRIYYIVPQTMRIFRTSDFDWADKDGAMLNRVANKDSYEAFLFHYGNLGFVVRNANGLLDDITE